MASPTPHTLALLFSLQETFRKLLPDCQEHIKSYGIAYTLSGARRGRIYSICHLTARHDGVQLGFIRGHLLQHPGLRAEGNQYKRSLLLRQDADFDISVGRLVLDAWQLAGRSMSEFR